MSISKNLEFSIQNVFFGKKEKEKRLLWFFKNINKV